MRVSYGVSAVSLTSDLGFVAVIIVSYVFIYVLRYNGTWLYSNAILCNNGPWHKDIQLHPLSY